jgi:hypothetical protein
MSSSSLNNVNNNIGKKAVGNTDEDFIRRRKTELEEYLKSVLSDPGRNALA